MTKSTAHTEPPVPEAPPAPPPQPQDDGDDKDAEQHAGTPVNMLDDPSHPLHHLRGV